MRPTKCVKSHDAINARWGCGTLNQQKKNPGAHGVIQLKLRTAVPQRWYALQLACCVIAFSILYEVFLPPLLDTTHETRDFNEIWPGDPLLAPLYGTGKALVIQRS